MFEKDCATKLKEKQLFKIFPAINQNFLVDIFKDHKWVLEGLSAVSVVMWLKVYVIHFNLLFLFFLITKIIEVYYKPFKCSNVESEEFLSIGSYSSSIFSRVHILSMRTHVYLFILLTVYIYIDCVLYSIL